MTRLTSIKRLRPPGPLTRTWYRRINDHPPTLCTHNLLTDLARLIPYRHRRTHQFIAAIGGYFWHPCLLCNKPFGGHETGKSIPDPTNPPLWVSICSQCSRNHPEHNA